MGRFAAKLQGFEDRSLEKIDRIIRYTVLEIRTRLIIRTPVDTGRARNGWILGVDARPAGEPGGLDPTGQGAAERIAAAVPYRAAGHVYFIANNVPYIRDLEDGGSKQAPSGMAKITLLEVPQIVDRAIAAAG